MLLRQPSGGRMKEVTAQGYPVLYGTGEGEE